MFDKVTRKQWALVVCIAVWVGLGVFARMTGRLPLHPVITGGLALLAAGLAYNTYTSKCTSCNTGECPKCAQCPACTQTPCPACPTSTGPAPSVTFNTALPAWGGKALAGSDLPGTGTVSADVATCQTRCSADPACLSGFWNADNKQCWLKNKKGSQMTGDANWKVYPNGTYFERG